ncbi:hypothetical protein Sfulv_06090 [Streptomyces fulvorobeus]|uniref:Uncharacterized protein n=2 Tax=Streptomyces fulvorobeus TaxID=284028 RepID=A0A7J0C062_9ACTN|nr:hypothetical protein Sfulv_06090 [Streptomyces fulvorobeus]
MPAGWRRQPAEGEGGCLRGEGVGQESLAQRPPEHFGRSPLRRVPVRRGRGRAPPYRARRARTGVEHVRAAEQLDGACPGIAAAMSSAARGDRVAPVAASLTALPRGEFGPAASQ